MYKYMASAFLALTFFGAAFAQELMFDIQVNKMNKPDSTIEKVISGATFAVKGHELAIVPQGVSDESDVRLIFNTKERSVTMLMTEEGRKYGFQMGMKEMDKTLDPHGMRKTAEKLAELEPIIVPTGKRKTIQGYSCSQYMVEFDSSFARIWATKDLDVTWGNVSEYLNRSMEYVGLPKSPYLNTHKIEGFPLEITVEDGRTGDVAVITFTGVTAAIDQKLFSTEGYQVLDMAQIRQLQEQEQKKIQQDK